jgi:hypothetical protein
VALAALDFSVRHPGVRSLRFDQPATIEGAPVVLWHPAGAAAHYANGAEAGGEQPTLGIAGSEALLGQSRRWRTALAGALAEGAVVAAFVPASTGFGVHTLQEVVHHDLLEAWPGGAPHRTPLAAPAPVRCIVGEPFRSFFEAVGGLLRVDATLAAVPGRVICVAGESDAVAGVYDYRHPGHLLLLPAPRADLCDDDRTRLALAVLDLARRLRRSGRLGPLAAWATAWTLPGEATLRNEAAALVRKHREIDDALARKRGDLDTLDLVKQLVAGDAAGVGRAAAHVIHALGGYAQPGMDDDATVAFEHRGVFGVITLARSDDAHWVEAARRNAAAFGAATGAESRPALLYCADNATPLADRTGPSQPLQDAARDAAIPLVTADALLRAWVDRERGILDRIIAGAPRRD